MNLNCLKNVDDLNAFEIAKLVLRGNKCLSKLKGTKLSAEEHKELRAAINKACANPLFRTAWLVHSNSDLWPPYEYDCLLENVHIGSLSPEVLGVLNDACDDEFYYLRKCLALIDLDILLSVTEKNGWQNTGFKYAVDYRHTVVVNVPEVFSDNKLREWWECYRVNLINHPMACYHTHYEKLWKYLAKMYDTPEDKIPVEEVSADTHFSNYPLDSLCLFSDGKDIDLEDFLWGTKTSVGFNVDLDLFRQALLAKNSGATCFRCVIHKGDYIGTHNYSIGSFLSEERVRLLADGYVEFLKAKWVLLQYGVQTVGIHKAAILSDIDKNYKDLFKYIMDTVFTADETLLRFTPPELHKGIKELLPIGWERFSLDDLSESIRSRT